MESEAVCQVCLRARVRDGSRASADACERQSKRKLSAAFRQAMAPYRFAREWIPEWAAENFMQAFRSVFYLRGYVAGYKAGLHKGALQVSRETDSAA